jgi:uncharacterized tellurite resistance protein B-like protein
MLGSASLRISTFLRSGKFAMEAMRKVEILRAACCVAAADGETDEGELRILQQLAAEVGVGEASLTAMIDRAESDPNFYTEQFRVLKADPDETLKLLLGVAIADRRLGRDECQVLQRLAERLNVPAEKFNRWLTQEVDSIKAKSRGNEADSSQADQAGADD